jgi:hypothetical protein
MIDTQFSLDARRATLSYENPVWLLTAYLSPEGAGFSINSHPCAEEDLLARRNGRELIERLGKLREHILDYFETPAGPAKQDAWWKAIQAHRLLNA